MSEHIREIMERCQRNMEEYAKNDAWRAEINQRIAAEEAFKERVQANSMRPASKPPRRYRSPDDGSTIDL